MLLRVVYGQILLKILRDTQVRPTILEGHMLLVCTNGCCWTSTPITTVSWRNFQLKVKNHIKILWYNNFICIQNNDIFNISLKFIFIKVENIVFWYLDYIIIRLILKVIAKSEDDKCFPKGENTHNHKSLFTNENYRFINKNLEQSFFARSHKTVSFWGMSWSIV